MLYYQNKHGNIWLYRGKVVSAKWQTCNPYDIESLRNVLDDDKALSNLLHHGVCLKAQIKVVKGWI